MPELNNNTNELFLNSNHADFLREISLDRGLDYAQKVHGNTTPVPTSSPSDPDSIGERCFSLTTGRAVFGVCVAELTDSFLVAMPAILQNDGTSIVGKSLVTEPMIRIYKGNIVYSSLVQPAHRYHYYEYLEEFKDMFPGLITSEWQKIITRVLRLGDGIDLSSATGQTSSAPQDPEEDEGEDGLFSRYQEYQPTTRH